MKSYTLQQLSQKIGATLEGDPSFTITGVASLEEASKTDASFLNHPRYVKTAEASKAGVLVQHPTSPRTSHHHYLLHPQPDLAFQQVIELFLSERMTKSGFSGIHPTAVIHPTAIIGQNVTIAPYAVIDEKVTIGNCSFIGASCYIGPHTTIGEETILHPHVTIREFCKIGSHVIIQPGAVIGSCGFGYTQTREGKHLKLAQLGTITIEDDVEIGANTTIDRARFTTTKISTGTKIDNQVQIAHGVEIGSHNIIAGQSGFAGSTTTGSHCFFGGQVGIDGHLHISPQAMVAARSSVSKSLLKPGKYGGIPASDLSENNRHMVQLRQIGKLIERVKALEERLKKL